MGEPIEHQQAGSDLRPALGKSKGSGVESIRHPTPLPTPSKRFEDKVTEMAEKKTKEVLEQ
jgi:hypothetical protein